MDKYEIVEVIGEGSFGRVFRGTRKSDGFPVALKLIPKMGHTDRELASLRSECKIQMSLSHPNIVRYSPQPGNGRGRERDGNPMREGCGKGAGIHFQFPHSRYFFKQTNLSKESNQK